MTPTVLLLSGTSEGPVLARALHQAGLGVHATVTRREACDRLFGSLAGSITVEARGFSVESLTDFLQGKQADLVLDATHPFAARITRIAHSVCSRLGVPFVRYERADWEPPAGTVFAAGFSEAAELLPTLGRRIALTIGSKQLGHFASLHGILQMHARILPAEESRRLAGAAGFSGDRLACAWPPFSRQANRDWLACCQAEVLVTKASGQEGGVVEKVLAAQELDCKVLMIRRPVLPDIPTRGSIEAALQACLKGVKERSQ